MRPVGDIYLDLEKLYDELVDDHNVQMGDMIYWLHGHLSIHRPDCIEEYVGDGSHPRLKYGPKANRKLTKKKLLDLLSSWEDCKLEGKCANQIIKLFDEEYK